jgi:tetratricopeptide (TPR) repeat protein
VVRGTFSPARAWRPTVGARLARTLGFRFDHQMLAHLRETIVTFPDLNFPLLVRRFTIALVIGSANPVIAGEFEDAAAAMERGDNATAIQIYSDFLSSTVRPAVSTSRALAFRGLAHARNGNYDKAIDDYTEAYVTSGWTWHDLLYERALAKEGKRDFDAAMADYDEVLIFRLW